MKDFYVQLAVLLALFGFCCLDSNLWACGPKRIQEQDLSLQEALLGQGVDQDLQYCFPQRGSLMSRYRGDHLSPIWWIIQSELVHSIGQAPGVSVGDPEVLLPQGRVRLKDLAPTMMDRYKNLPLSIEVHTSTRERASALAFVLKPVFEVGNVVLNVWVSGPDHLGIPILPTPALPRVDLVTFVQQNLQFALQDNPFFLGFTPKMNSHPSPNFFILFNREEIQFFADNLKDAYRNINAVAEDVFADVLNLQYFNGLVRVGVSTIERSFKKVQSDDPTIGSFAMAQRW